MSKPTTLADLPSPEGYCCPYCWAIAGDPCRVPSGNVKSDLRAVEEYLMMDDLDRALDYAEALEQTAEKLRDEVEAAEGSDG